MDPKLMRRILIQIEASLRDKARSFSVKDVSVDSSSRATTYRYIKSLREIGVIEKIGRERYAASEEFKQELVEEIRS